jgi:hypothetical protein
LAAFAVSHLAPAAPSVLRSVRYSALGTTSRLTLWFDGPVHYTTVRQEGKILLGFTGTRVGSPPGAARIPFSTGHVRGVTIDRIGLDSARVTIALREGTACRFHEPTADGALVLEVSPAGMPPATLPAPRRVSTEHVAAPARTVQTPPAGRSGIVDIPALARTQVEQERTAPQTVPPAVKASAPATTAPPSAPTSTPAAAEAYLALGTVAVLLAAAGLIWAVVRVMRRNRRTRARAAASTPVPATLPAATAEHTESAAGVRALLEREMSIRRTRSDVVDEADKEEEEDEAGEEETIALAKTYGRGKEELHLAFTLQERGRRSSTRDQMERIAAGSRTPAARVRAARKLGTGVGEVELAARLGKLKARVARKETER